MQTTIPAGNSQKIVAWCKRDLSKYDMKDLGLLHVCLGLEVWQDTGNVLLSQGKFAVEILKRFNMLTPSL
jgi:hypothetical protein